MSFSISRSGGVFGTLNHNHLQLRRDHIEPFKDILADAMLETTAARASRGVPMIISSRGRCGGSALRLICLLRTAAGFAGRCGVLLGGCLRRRDRLLQIFKRKRQLPPR
jgi:hypothetical protein